MTDIDRTGQQMRDVIEVPRLLPQRAWPFMITLARTVVGLIPLLLVGSRLPAGEWSGAAGDGGDADPTTFSFSPTNEACVLVDAAGRELTGEQWLASYGTPEGLTVRVDGVDVCSPESAECRGLVNIRPLRPFLADLSKPVRVPNGRIAIDPQTGRFRFADGDQDPVRLVGMVHLPNCWAEDVAVRGRYVYVAGDEEEKGLCVIDAQDPTHPQPVGASGLVSGFADHVAVFKDDYVLVTGNMPHLMVYDVKDPRQPVLIGTASYGIGRGGGPMAVAGDYVFVSGGPLRVISLKDPHHPEVVASVYEDKFWKKSIQIRGDYLYAARGTLTMVDIRDPLEPAIVQDFAYRDGPKAQAVALAGQFAVVLDSNTLWVVDLSNPASPRTRGHVDIGAAGHATRPGLALAAEGHLACVANNSRLSVFDISDPGKPVLRGSVDFARNEFTPSPRFQCTGMAMQDKRVTVSDYYYGVFIIDVSNPESPREIGRAPAAGEVRDVYAWDGKVAITDYNGGVFFIDASEPAQPRITRQFYMGSIERTVTGDHRGFVFAIGGAGGVFDARDIRDVKRLAPLSGDLGLAWHRGTVYTSGIQRYDVSDPGAPKVLLPVTEKTQCWGLGCTGKFLYASVSSDAKNRRGIATFDVSDPGQPGKELSFLETPVGRSYLFARKGWLCIPYWNPRGCSEPTSNRIEVYDIATDPASPRLVHTIFRYDGVWGPHKVVLEGDLLYVAEYMDGIKIFDLREITSPRLVAHHLGGYRMNFGMDVDGPYLYRGRLGALEILDVPRPCESPRGKVTVRLPAPPRRRG